MATQILVPDDPNPVIRVSLGTKYVFLVFRYSSRADCWYMDIYESDYKTVIISGLMIKPNQNLTGRYVLPGLPGGNIWCVRMKASSGEIGRNDLKENYGILWMTTEEELEVGLDGRISI